MAKVFTYVIILMGISLLLSFAGIPTASYKLVNTVLGNDTITSTGDFNETAMDAQSSNLIGWGTAIFLLFVGASLLATFLFHAAPESAIIATFAGFLFTMVIADLYAIITHAFTYGTWVGLVVTLIMAPLIAGFFVAMISWWRGTDS